MELNTFVRTAWSFAIKFTVVCAAYGALSLLLWAWLAALLAILFTAYFDEYIEIASTATFDVATSAAAKCLTFFRRTAA